MLMQHVMYHDIMDNRRYLLYPYFESFDPFDDRCMYCYADKKNNMHIYLASYASSEHIKNKVFEEIKASMVLSEIDEEKMMNLFSSSNPSLRLAIYSGAKIDRQRVIDDMKESGDIKKTMIELTGEINAAAIDGLFSLYVSSLEYLEGERHTNNTRIMQDYYVKLKNSSYVYMKRGSATQFMLMPLNDLKKAIENNSVEDLMESASHFLEVYILNNSVDRQLDD